MPRHSKETKRSKVKIREEEKADDFRLHPDTKKSVAGVVLAGMGIFFILVYFGKAGPFGESLFRILDKSVGWGYLALPVGLFLAAGVFFTSTRHRIFGSTIFGIILFFASVLGLIEIFAPGEGGWLGMALGALKYPLGEIAAALINIITLLVSLLITLNLSIKIPYFGREEIVQEEESIVADQFVEEEKIEEKGKDKKEDSEKREPVVLVEESRRRKAKEEAALRQPSFAGKAPSLFDENYVFPPLSLLKTGEEKPSIGDLRANANIIKRTLESFGIPVEMGEINVGPAVTRYTLKPAEGIKLSKITALNQDLSLALAAHPIRIEAPIPGKSLVGIEVPNRAAALVRLSNLMTYPEFQSSGLLSFAVGRDVSGKPVFANIDKMPHLLIAGATGSGKSVMIHSLLVSLLYKNSPKTLRLVLIDPKRVELSLYRDLPHLIGPVILESKKALGVFRWAIGEMDRRYDTLLQAGARDIKSYNAKFPERPLPYVLIVIDELADLMTSYGRDVEGYIVRLAQMARATGLHLILSTQRPSVEIITGLIKANITSRIAMQVASQVDSRTILDTAGAEKLLGSGDLLFVSAELSKPKRIQGAYISEEEVKKVTEFIRKNNGSFGGGEEEEDLAKAINSNESSEKDIFDHFLEEEEGDELYEEAVEIVRQAKKASASLLQRRLKIGYARAARLLDLMEAKRIIGPGEGAKPREVYLDNIGSNESV